MADRHRWFTARREVHARECVVIERHGVGDVGDPFADRGATYVLSPDDARALRDDLTRALDGPPQGLYLLDYPDREAVPSRSNKIAVIKAIREITGLGLAETKRLVESPPPVLVALGSRRDLEDRNRWVREALYDLERCATVEWREVSDGG